MSTFESRWVEDAFASADEPRAKLVNAFEAVATLATSLQCLGCAFQAAASEFPDLGHPGQQVAVAHKLRVAERLTEVARDAGLSDPEALAAQLLLLMDGAWVAARMFGPDNHAVGIADAARALIDGRARAGDTAS